MAKTAAEENPRSYAAIESASEQLELANEVGSTYPSVVWIGLTASSGRWEWVTGEPLEQGFWDGEEPAVSTSSECAAMWKDSNYSWFGEACTVGMQFLCER